MIINIDLEKKGASDHEEERHVIERIHMVDSRTEDTVVTEDHLQFLVFVKLQMRNLRRDQTIV